MVFLMNLLFPSKRIFCKHSLELSGSLPLMHLQDSLSLKWLMNPRNLPLSEATVDFSNSNGYPLDIEMDPLYFNVLCKAFSQPTYGFSRWSTLMTLSFIQKLLKTISNMLTLS